MKAISSHILKGFNYAVPLIIIYSVLLAIDGTSYVSLGKFPEYVLFLVIPVLTTAIASHIAPKVVLFPGFLLGMYFDYMGVGFFGAIFGGLILGYSILFMIRQLHVQRTWVQLVIGYLILPLVATGVTYVVMHYVIDPPILWMLDQVRQYVSTIKPNQILLLVGILGALSTVDLGGPFNKLAFGFVMQFYRDGYYSIVGPVLISTAIPPIAIALALYLIPHKFSVVDRSTLKFAFSAALVGFTEGALPVTFRRPLKILPIIVFGSVTASLFAAYFHMSNVVIMVSVLGLIGASNILVYVLAHVVGVAIILALFLLVLRNQEKESLHN